MSNSEIQPTNNSKLPQMTALDSLIGSFQSKINDLKAQQTQIQKDSESTSALGYIDSDPRKTYNHIEDALETGLNILDQAKMLIEAAPDADGFIAASEVMKAVQSLFGEFTAIWQKQINYQNAVNLEMLKLKNKKELEEYKMQLKLNYFNQTTAHEIESEENKKIPFNTKDFIDALD